MHYELCYYGLHFFSPISYPMISSGYSQNENNLKTWSFNPVQFWGSQLLISRDYYVSSSCITHLKTHKHLEPLHVMSLILSPGTRGAVFGLLLPLKGMSSLCFLYFLGGGGAGKPLVIIISTFSCRCLVQWLDHSNSCPLCKQKVRQDSENTRLV